MDKKENTEEFSWRCWLRTLFAGSGAMMVFVFTGITEGQSAVMLPQLKKEGSSIHVTQDEGSWIASLGVVLSPISAILVGQATDAFGRKKGLQFFYLSMSLGFGAIACATEITHIYIGRCICAFAVGLEVVAHIFLAEICTKKQRSAFYSVLSAMFAGGLALCNVVGGYLPWYIASAAFSLAAFVFFIIQCCTPESPAWLYKTGQTEASAHSLQRLGRSEADISQELEFLKLSSNDKAENLEFRTFLEPTVWKPFVILATFHILQNATGLNDIMYYSVDLVESLGTTYDPLTISIIISIARFATNATLGIYFTALVSRKFSVAFSGLWMTCSLVGAGLYEYVYRDTPVINRPAQWVPVTLMVVNIVTSGIGMANLPWRMSGEVFPLRVRGAMSAAVYVVGSGVLFIFVKIYWFRLDVLQTWGLLFSYAVPSFLTVFFAIYLLPETHNKTLYEVEQVFLPKHKRQQSTDCESQKQRIESIVGQK